MKTISKMKYDNRTFNNAHIYDHIKLFIKYILYIAENIHLE